jgi:hypothetical protein
MRIFERFAMTASGVGATDRLTPPLHGEHDIRRSQVTPFVD